MNFKNFRKEYFRLSKVERFVLYDSAENRNDKSEMEAVVNASPDKYWQNYDFAEIKHKITLMRMTCFTYRLKYIANVFFYLSDDSDFFYQCACLEAYLYTVAVKAQETIFEEMGLDKSKWFERQNEAFNFEIVAILSEKLIQSIAFTEQEAEDFVKKLGDDKGFGEITLGFTYENQLEVYRTILKHCGLSEMFKD